jgi:hypothetical protein
VVSLAAGPEAPVAARRRPFTPALVFLAGQALVLGVVWAAAAPAGWSVWALLQQWDARHFEDVARSGYTGDLYAFFPGFPLLVRLVTVGTTLPVDVAGVLVSVAAGVVLAYGVDRLTREIAGAGGPVAVALVAVLPLSVVFLMPYSEATFCALAVWTLVALGRGRILLGSVLCAGAGLVRPTGVALVVAVVVAALASEDRRRGTLAVAVAPLGVVGYLGWVALRTGSLTGWADRQHAGWGTGFDGGAATWAWLRTIPTRGALAIDLAILAAAIACAVTVGVLLRRRRTADAAYVGAVLVLALGTSGVWNSRYRLLLPALVVGCALAGPVLLRLRTPARVVALAAIAAVGCCVSAYLLTSFPYAL